MELAPFAQWIARTRGLYLDHLGTELGEQGRRVGSRDQGAELEYLDSSSTGRLEVELSTLSSEGRERLPVDSTQFPRNL